MKKIYIYPAILIAALIILAILYNDNDTGAIPEQPAAMEQSSRMPNDEAHKGLGGGAGSPSADNVMSEIKHRLSVLKKSVEENPSDTTDMKAYADLLAMAHQPEKAVEYYNEILKIDDTRIDIYTSLAFVYYNQGKFDNALNVTERLLKADSNNAGGYYNLGAIYASKGDKEKAREYWESVIKKFPDSRAAEMAKVGLSRI